MNSIRILEAVAGWVFCVLVPGAAFGLFCGYVLSLPVRRQERSRFFLTVIETGLKAGWSLKQTLVEMSRTGDPVFGPSFHVLAAYLENGYSLGRAVQRVPGFLNPRVAGALQAAEETGQWRKILPVCHNMLQGATSQVRAAVNYQITLLLIVNPVVWLTVPFAIDKILPVFLAISAGFGFRPPPSFQMLLQFKSGIYFSQLGLSFFLCALAILYAGGPLLSGWLQAGLFPVGDWIELRIPWRRKRLLRDFSSMAALLLDANLPETRALRLAAESVNNRILSQWVEQAATDLSEGLPLAEAIRRVDASGELCWRLRNAARGREGFSASLRGWHEGLEASAFQQEQAAAQVLTTVLLLLNGFLVSLIATALFGGLSEFNRLLLRSMQ